MVPSRYEWRERKSSAATGMTDAEASAGQPDRFPRATQAEHRARALCEMFDLCLTEEDLVGLEVVTADGDLVGTVTGLELGPQDRLVVAVEGGVVRIPFVEEIVPEIDEDTRRVVVAPPAGLLELVEDE